MRHGRCRQSTSHEVTGEARGSRSRPTASAAPCSDDDSPYMGKNDRRIASETLSPPRSTYLPATKVVRDHRGAEEPRSHRFSSGKWHERAIREGAKMDPP